MLHSPSNTHNGKPEASSLRITSMGSSFAAGPGIPPQLSRAAMRSGNNYPHILAGLLGGQLTDLTVSGATLRNLYCEPQVRWLRSFEPQITLLEKETDIVMVTAGGNDLGYIRDIMEDTFRASYMGQAVGQLLPRTEKKERLTAEDVANHFVELIDQILQIAPSCQILLVEYLTLFGCDARPGVDVWMNEKQVQHYQNLAETLKTAYSMAETKRHGKCKVIKVAERSWGHGLGSDEPWVEGFDWGMLVKGIAPFHPNARGMAAVANIIYDELK